MEIQEKFAQFNQLKVVIVGDVMIDSYLWGKVERISPEAPVAVVNLQKREKRLGGAGNVALNIKALGAEPFLCSVIGDDSDAQLLEDLLNKNQISSQGIVRSPARKTTIKHRVLGGSQHLLRIDSEDQHPVQANESAKLLTVFEELAQKADVIIFQDYDKGVLTAENIPLMLGIAQEKQIPTVIDPKKRNFKNYRGATLFKPNLKELREGLDMNIEPNSESLSQAIEILKEETGIENAMITLSEDGVFIQYNSDNQLIPAHKREIADVSGAGDTVISVAAVCLASGFSGRWLAEIANLGGGLVCEHAGVVPISKVELEQEVLKIFKS